MYWVLGYWTVYCTQSGGVHIFSKHKSKMYTFVQPWGVSIFSPKTQKCHVYFCTTKGGGSRRDPNHKSMYKCAYMYLHLSFSPPPPPPPPDKLILKNFPGARPPIPPPGALSLDPATRPPPYSLGGAEGPRIATLAKLTERISYLC